MNNHLWSAVDVQWRNANWTWKEVELVEEILSGNQPGVPGEWARPPWLEDKPYNAWDKEKRKVFVRLICKVKGEPAFDEGKEIREDIKITVKDIKLVVKAVKGIDVEILEE
jgi:hypothetical protein